MRITEIYIKSFGALHDKRIEPSQGMTLIYGGNESGKSTLAGFIKFVFYGLSQKEKWEGLSEKERYISWQDHLASGHVTLCCQNGKSYRIEREVIFSKKAHEQLVITDLESGNTVNGVRPQDYFLGGISPEVFSKTCFVSQYGGGKVGGEQIKNAVENMTSGGDEDANAQNAISLLEKARTKLLYKNQKGGSIFENQEETRACLQKKQRALETLEESQALSHSLETKKAELEEKKRLLASLDKKIDISQAMLRLQQINGNLEQRGALAERKRELDEFLAASTVNGFLPDQSYKQELEAVYNGVQAEEAELERLKKEKENCLFQASALKKKHALACAAWDMQGAAEALDKKNKCASVSIIVLSVLAAAGIAAGFAINGFAFIVSAIFTLAVIVMAVAKIRLFAERKTLYSRVKAQNKEDFLQLLTQYRSFHMVLEQISEKQARLDQQTGKCQERLNLLLSKLSTLAKKWGGENLPPDKLIKKVTVFMERYQESKKYVRQKEEEVGRITEEYAQSELEALREKTAGYSHPPIPLSQLFEKSRERQLLLAETDALQSSISKTERLLERSLATLPDINQINRRTEELMAEGRRLEDLHQGVLLAISALQEAAANTRGRFAPSLSKKASQLVSLVTSGKYQSVTVDKDMSLSFSDGEGSMSIAHLSDGTRAAIYLAFRTSLTSELFPDTPPMIFDESFVFLDSERLRCALTAIYQYCAQNKAQCFIFTCTEREASLLSREKDIDYKIIEL